MHTYTNTYIHICVCKYIEYFWMEAENVTGFASGRGNWCLAKKKAGGSMVLLACVCFLFKSVEFCV